MRGYFEIGIYNGKTSHNLGTLWRTAYQMGAAGIFTIGGRYKTQASDTYQSYRHIPLRQFETIAQFLAASPHDCPIVGVEMGGTPLREFAHPVRALYVLGAEDSGLPMGRRAFCHRYVALPAGDTRPASYNVAVAGALVMAHRQFFGK